MRGILVVLASAATCAALISVAVLMPAPPAVIPVIVLVCVICPMVTASELPGAVATVRGAGRRRLGTRHLTRLLDQLERLPEVEHPRGY